MTKSEKFTFYRKLRKGQKCVCCENSPETTCTTCWEVGIVGGWERQPDLWVMDTLVKLLVVEDLGDSWPHLKGGVSLDVSLTPGDLLVREEDKSFFSVTHVASHFDSTDFTQYWHIEARGAQEYEAFYYFLKGQEK